MSIQIAGEDPVMFESKYFSKLKVVTHENVREPFLAMSDIPNEDVSMLGALYFNISYLYSRDYKKVVEHFLFVLVEDFDVIAFGAQYREAYVTYIQFSPDIQ